MRDERDHLMNDASGLASRMEICVAPQQWWVVGERENHAVSVFAGDDFVLQFNPAGELRRVFADGTRLKADGGQLWTATRVAQRGSMQLRSTPLSSEDAEKLLDQAAATLRQLAAALNEAVDSLEPAGGEPVQDAKSGAVGRVVASDAKTFLQNMHHWAQQQSSGRPKVARRPHAGG